MDDSFKENDDIYIALAYVSDWTKEGNEYQVTVKTYSGDFTIGKIDRIDDASDYGVLVDKDLNF